MSQVSVIIGPPGTGKTTTLAAWAARAAERYGPDRVLVSSLTRTAASHAARNVELPWSQFGTVHAFAYRALGSPELAEAHTKEWNEAFPMTPLTGQHAVPDDGFEMPESATPVDATKLEYDRLRTLGTLGQGVVSTHIQAFQAQWTDWKTQCGYQDFHDLIHTALTDVDTAPGNPAVLFNDEAQDTGTLEMQLLLKWAKHTEHFVALGDPGQALFSFRGTNPYLLQDLRAAHDPERQPLQQSYRLSRAVYQVAQGWMGRFQKTLKVTYLPRDVDGFVRPYPTPFGHLTPPELNALVMPYLDQGKSVMFLATCGYMLDPVLRGLREVGLPFYNPYRVNHGGWNPLPQKRSKGLTVIDRVLAFCRPLEVVWGDQARFWTVADVKAWVGGLPVEGILQRGAQKAVQELPDDLPDTELAGRLRGLFAPQTMPYLMPEPSLPWYLARCKGSEKLRQFVGRINERFGPRTLMDRPQVIVGTIHSLKGAEADVVVLCPDISPDAYRQGLMRPEAAEELRRVFYTGVTRARDGLILTAPGGATAVRW